MNLDAIATTTTACQSIICQLENHPGLATWFGGFANLLVTIVALAVPFIVAWISTVKDRQIRAGQALYASRQALRALALLDDLQGEVYEIQRTPLGGTIGRAWAFEFRTMARLMEDVCAIKYADLVLSEKLTQVYLWSLDAQTWIPTPGGSDQDRVARARDSLAKLQGYQQLRTQVHNDLENGLHILRERSSKWLPRNQRPKKVPAPLVITPNAEIA